MTSPAGDMPDWQTLVSPLVTAKSIFSQGPNVLGTILTMPNAFRVWGAWISIHTSSFAAYAAGLAQYDATIEDSAGNALFTIGADFQAANEEVTHGMSVPIPGLTPVPVGGNWIIYLATSNVPVTVHAVASAGIYYSVP